MANLPQTMRSLVAPKQCLPDEYEIQERPVPRVTLPSHVLIKMRAASIEVGELEAVSGKLWMFHTPTYPFPIGMQGSGVVVEVGSAVKNLKAGDEVYGLYMDKPAFRTPFVGMASEYALAEDRFLLPKPPHVSFEAAASLAGRVVTAYQVIRRGLQLRGEDSLEGKTVFVTGGLGGNGSVAIEMAKRVFGAKKIVTTVSTGREGVVREELGGLVDVVVDYKTQKVEDVIGKGNVDMVFNTQMSTLTSTIPLLNPSTGTLMSIASIPTKKTVTELIGADKMPLWLGWTLDLAQLWYKWKLAGTNIKHEMVSGGVQIREDLEKAGEIVATGKVRGLVTVVDWEDLDKVREACMGVVRARGGLGKLVLRIG